MGLSRSIVSNMPNTFTRVFDNIGSKCKIICRFKISAKAGIQIENNGFRVKPGMTIKVKGLLTQYTRNQGVTKMVNPFFIEMGIQKFKV